jgi:hypothetical protein
MKEETKMKKMMITAITATLILSMMVLTASAFIPPGQMKKDDGQSWLANRARVMALHEGRWDDEVLEEALYGPGRELPPGLRGKSIPPGLLKKGLVLPPGLSGRDESDLPPGIIMRFLEAAERRVPTRDEDAEVDSVIVRGNRTLIIPNQGSYNVQYEAVVRDQFGNAMRNESVTWELRNPDNIQRVMINEDTGLLTINQGATEGTIGVVAISDTDRSVQGVLRVELRMPETARTARVSNESELRRAVNADFDVIMLSESIFLDTPLVINRSLTLDGMAHILAPSEEFDGEWLIHVTAEGVRLENLYLDGFETDPDNQKLVLVRVRGDMMLDAEYNRLMNASEGFSFRVSVLDERTENQLLRQNGFSNVEFRVGFYE